MLRTARLTLRPARPDDLDDLHAVFSNPLAMRYWDSPPFDRAATRRHLEYMMNHPDSREFVIERNGRAIGKAGCWRLPEIGYILHPEHWGQGYATEALYAAVRALFDQHGDLTELVAEIDPRNLASARVLAKLGFAVTGHASRVYEVNGEWVDATYLALDRRNLPVRPPLSR